MNIPSRTDDYDVIIIGGGPTGSTAGIRLARAGLRVLIVERSRFPRFHVGESCLPAVLKIIRELGLEDRLRALPHVPKFGGEFAFGYDLSDSTRFRFADGLVGGKNDTFNVERAPFDKMMLDGARDAGVEVREGASVTAIQNLADGDVTVAVDGQPVSARYVLDASGQSTVLGKHLGTRRTLERHRRVAYFGHFENVKRLEGADAGHPTVVICSEGWFWLIPIDPVRTSIGMVLEADIARHVDVPANQMLKWGIARCPLVRDRTREAACPEKNHVIADYSYSCAPYAGPGYFLAGDSAFFVDPIFSAGICIGMVTAIDAADRIRQLIDGTVAPAKARRRYIKVVRGGSSPLLRLVDLFYVHSYRELFLQGEGPFQIHRAVISVLAGHVFPRPAFALRWRMRLMELLVFLNRFLPIVPRRRRFSLLEEPVHEDEGLVEALSVST